ncbi:MAG TPA: TonB-dependent receptor [Vicinamibacterales bacterium]|nr:TonB-dependent receptor [Vicinamibacterales bacterium]
MLSLIAAAMVAAIQVSGNASPAAPAEQEPPQIEVSVIVEATRTGGRLEESPLRVEVLEREEVEEKMLMTPGDIVMMLNEMGGMRVQATSPSLGAASVRVQGMRGRYTRVLSDGLPLFGEVGGLGLLQIPPMDLGQVEVIKGVASSLYGAGAMGGVINLVSRVPADTPLREFLINRSTRGGTDAVAFLSQPLADGWGLTFLGGGHWQERADVDEDGWSDLPRYSRGLARPRVFWSNGAGNRFFATAGVTIEDREGGSASHVESLDTESFDAGLLDQRIVGGAYVLTTRAALSRKSHAHLFGPNAEDDVHSTAFGEFSIRGAAQSHTWVAGVAIESDRYRNDQVKQFDHAFTVPGVFVQDDFVVKPWLSLSGSARLDYHNEYGTFFSPRISALVHSNEWQARASFGTGFFGPSALTEETEAAGLTLLQMPNPLRAERGRSASIDLTRTAGPLSTTVTVFTSRVIDSIKVNREIEYTIGNADKTTNVGSELLATFRREPFALTGTYTYVHARERDETSETDVPLTPRHSAGMVAVLEKEDAGRIGVELYYTGEQRLEANPYADRSEPYVIVGVLGERHFGRLRLFINGENLTGVRQTKWQPLARPTPAVDGRMTVDAWAPLEGWNINGGIRLSF